MAKKTTRKPQKGGSGKARKTNTRTTTKKKTTKPNPIPTGLRTVNASLVVNGAEQAIEFYAKGFGGRPRNVQRLPDGKIMHAEVRIGDTVVMLSDEFPGAPVRSPASVGAATSLLHVYSKDVDELWERATNAGAEVVMPLGDQFWEERYGQVKDPFGHVWALSQRIKLTRQQVEQKRREAEAMMSAPPPSSGNGGQERNIFS